APKQYSEADGIAFDEIAALTPDVILASYSGLSQEDYDTLSKIAPVVAYPDTAWGTPWQDSTRMIGQALGKADEAEALVAETEKTIADKAAQYPQLQDKTFIYGNLEPDRGDGINIYLEEDNRPRFLTSLGMTMSPFVAEKGKESPEFYLPWSNERANELESDIFVTWVPDQKTKDAIREDPLLGQIPAVRTGALVADTDNTLTLSISAATPLSLPWALDKSLPLLGEAADAADAAK
ncbi:ABC transporter substrate-binding protein, partial [Arthrobacter deserti]|nr:ABC transporter substrate-binding protein [Arthrobacter deserti]